MKHCSMVVRSSFSPGTSASARKTTRAAFNEERGAPHFQSFPHGLTSSHFFTLNTGRRSSLCNLTCDCSEPVVPTPLSLPIGTHGYKTALRRPSSGCLTLKSILPTHLQGTRRIGLSASNSSLSLSVLSIGYEPAMVMERQVFPTSVEFFSQKQHGSGALASPDPEARGRKRRRDPIHLTFNRPQHNPSAGSTLRGRCRHRSPSRLAVASRTASRGTRDASPCASKRRLVATIKLRPENHRRSRSPSRSRSMGDSNVVPSKRRRQRTQSRSRPHNEKETLSPITQSPRTAIGFGILPAQDHKKDIGSGNVQP